MYENKKTFESILVLIVDLCSLIVSMGLAFWLRYGIFYGRFEHGDQIWLLFFAEHRRRAFVCPFFPEWRQ